MQNNIETFEEYVTNLSNNVELEIRPDDAKSLSDGEWHNDVNDVNDPLGFLLSDWKNSSFRVKKEKEYRYLDYFGHAEAWIELTKAFVYSKTIEVSINSWEGHPSTWPNQKIWKKFNAITVNELWTLYNKYNKDHFRIRKD
tara:strand:- start:142 stop:564 length:423 start_codon:yes stop_codon:yes gene_type:complete